MGSLVRFRKLLFLFIILGGINDLTAESTALRNDIAGFILNYHNEITILGQPIIPLADNIGKENISKFYRLSISSISLSDSTEGPGILSQTDRILARKKLSTGTRGGNVGLPDVMIEVTKIGTLPVQIWYMLSQFEYGVIGFQRHMLFFTKTHMVLITLDPGPFRKEIMDYYPEYFGYHDQERKSDLGWIKDHQELAAEIQGGRWAPRLKDLEKEFKFILNSLKIF